MSVMFSTILYKTSMMEIISKVLDLVSAALKLNKIGLKFLQDWEKKNFQDF